MTTTETTSGFANADSILRKVQLLLAKAEDQAATPEESASYHAKAAELMAKYKIEEEQARATTPIAMQTRPVVREMDVCSAGSDHFQSYYNMAVYAASHAGAMVKHKWGRGQLIAILVGYDVDCRFAEMLFTSAKLVFQENMEPQRKADEPEALTAYRFRNAGKTRREVAVMLWGKDVDKSVAAHQKVQKWYEEEAARRGTPVVSGRGVSRKDFVKVYCESFTSKFYQRLRLAADASDSVGGAVELANRYQTVKEAFYEQFPSMRPGQVESASAYTDKRTQAQKDRDARAAEREAEKRSALYRSAAGRAGWAAGTAAAEKVDIQGIIPAKRLGE